MCIRDRLYTNCEWLDQEFSLIDTGGIELKNVPFMEEIKAQAQLAIDEADVIVLVTDGLSLIHILTFVFLNR